MNFKKLKWIIVVTIITSLIQTVVHAQKISWGETIKGAKGYEPQIIGEDSTAYYVYSCSQKELIIEKHEKANLKTAYSKKHDVVKNHKLEKAVLTGNKILFFFSNYDKDKKKTQLYCNTYLSNDGTKAELMNVLFSANLESEERSAGRENGTKAVFENEKYDLLTTRDNKKILITHEQYSEKQEKHTRNYLLVDADLKKLVEKKEEISRDEDKTFYTSGSTLDDAGSLYFFKNYHGTGNYKTSLICYDANKAYDSYEYLIDTTKLLIIPGRGELSTSTITFDKAGNMIIVGEFIKHDLLTGYYFVKINTTTKQTIESKLNEFPENFINQFRTTKQIKKGKDAVVPRGFNKIKLIVKEDGGVIGIAEMYTRGELTRRVKQGSFTTVQHVGEFYIYNDIIAINLNADGTMLWANRIPRNQICKYKYVNDIGRDLVYFSHFVTLSNDKLFIGYNDTPSNVSILSDNEKLKRFKHPEGSLLALFTIDLKTGEKEKSQFLDGMNPEVKPEPKSAYQKSQNSDMIIIGSNGKKFKNGVMSFGK